MQYQITNEEVNAVKDQLYILIDTVQKYKHWKVVELVPISMSTMELQSGEVLKLQLTINLPFATLFNFMANPSFQQKANPLIDKSLLVLQKGRDVKVLHIFQKGSMWMSVRDMVVVNTLKRLYDNKGIIGFKSCDYSQPQRDTVRAEVIIQAFILQRIDNNSVGLTYYCHIDLKGMLPEFIKSKLMKERSRFVVNLQQIIKDQLKI